MNDSPSYYFSEGTEDIYKAEGSLPELILLGWPMCPLPVRHTCVLGTFWDLRKTLCHLYSIHAYPESNHKGTSNRSGAVGNYLKWCSPSLAHCWCHETCSQWGHYRDKIIKGRCDPALDPGSEREKIMQNMLWKWWNLNLDVEYITILYLFISWIQ